MSRLRTYAQLVRLPNLPSALADIALGALAFHALPDRWLPFLFLLLTSACLYCAGMVWNDYFDRDEDRRDRPFRPIPSGRVSPRHAIQIGFGLLLAGVLAAGAAGWTQRLYPENGWPWTPVVLAILLVAALLLYDGPLKHAWAGPLFMGLCRFLNVLLGVSTCGSLPGPGYLLAAVVGVYIVGVTWFARSEERVSSRRGLQGAAGVILASLMLALVVPVSGRPGTCSPLFPYLLVAFGFMIGVPISRALESPTAERVQASIKRCLMGLILFDAILASALTGSLGLILLVLMIPSLYLNRKAWLYAT